MNMIKKIPFANCALDIFLWYTNTNVLFIVYLQNKLYESQERERKRERKIMPVFCRLCIKKILKSDN